MSGWSWDAGTSTWITALSVEVSEPTSVALAVEPFWNVTLIVDAPATTCSAGMMLPFESISKPVPMASNFCDDGLGRSNGLLLLPLLVSRPETVTVTTPGASFS